VGSTSLPEPDLLFFRTEHLDRMRASGVHEAPDFAVEIVDSNTARHNAVRKQAQYQEVGVTELWVIDLPRRELRHFLLDAGTYRRVSAPAGEEVVSRTVDGFRLRVDWLFQGPDFPSSLETVTALL
jgi:Uma2 family endonuclease